MGPNTHLGSLDSVEYFPMTRKIPPYIISVLAEVFSRRESHATLDSLFAYAEAPEGPPDGTKWQKSQDWLRRVNKETEQPFRVLGLLVEKYLEGEEDDPDKEKIERVLERAGLKYVTGGKIFSPAGGASRSLEQLIRGRDFESIEEEFDRALESVDARPREAISAACNILEAVFKTYIEDEGLEMPAKKDLRGVWNVIRKELGLDASQIEDEDLRQIVTGMGSVVSGLASLRTHASTAHAPGRKRYRPQPRHARLAVHSAHTLAAFILETWDHRTGDSAEPRAPDR